MALGTVVRSGLGALAILLVALDALGMESIGALHDLGVLDLGFIGVAIQTGFRNFASHRSWGVTHAAGDRFDLLATVGMVAVRACQRIALDGGMGLVVKKNLSSIGVIHQSDRFLGRWDREGGVTDNSDQQELDRHAVHDQTVLL
jgi:hypothetical protein